MSNEQKINYGIDASRVIRNLFIIGAITIILLIFFRIVKIGKLIIDITWLIWTAFYLFLGEFLVLVYSLSGKFKHKERMLNMVSLSGDEQVLDIRTVKGLLMVGVAKKLTTGKSIGIDIWNEEDIKSNNIENA